MWQQPNAYFMDKQVVVPRDRTEVNITTVSETLQFWHKRLIHQEKHLMRKLLERLEINMSMAETKVFSDGCVLDKAL
jgi:hypothetical protein